jgi:hypothetical protein
MLVPEDPIRPSTGALTNSESATVVASSATARSSEKPS